MSLEKELGRALNAAERHHVPTLNDVTATMVGELRRLSWENVSTYLRFHLREGSEHAFEDFARDVIEGGADPRTWGFRSVLVLVPEQRRGQALTMSVEQLKATLANVEGERWARLSVADGRVVNRGGGASGWGAPGVLARDVPYWWRPASPEIRLHIVSSSSMTKVIPCQTDAISDAGLQIAFRRWVAFRASWWLALDTGAIAASRPQSLAEKIGIDPDQVSVDGAVALAALIREAALPFEAGRDVRGYVGSDELFSGDGV